MTDNLYLTGLIMRASKKNGRERYMVLTGRVKGNSFIQMCSDLAIHQDIRHKNVHFNQQGIQRNFNQQ